MGWLRPAPRRRPSVRFDPGPVVLRGRFPEFEGASAVYSPRRTLLDKLLVDAARAAGAEVRERFAFDSLVFDGDRVTGIRGRSAGGGAVSETARLVVGADGRHSAVAKAVQAPAYHVKPALSTAYYTYWSGVELAGGEIYSRECVKRLVGAWPTNDGLVMTYVAAPASEFHAFRADPEGAILAALDRCGDLGERVRAGERAERVFGTADTRNRFHQPFGAGWALVGDAGLVMDPVTGAGIADALRDAELLADAVAAGPRRRSAARRGARRLPGRARRRGPADVRDDDRPRVLRAAAARAGDARARARRQPARDRPLPVGADRQPPGP